MSATIRCLRCGYSGHGFFLKELVPNYSPVTVKCDDGLGVRLDRGELRFDEVENKSDRLVCPTCSHEFEISVGVEVEYSPRHVAVGHAT